VHNWIPNTFCSFDIDRKTCAFLLPMLHRIISVKQKQLPKEFSTTRGLVVTPTRELAQQIHDQIVELCAFLDKCAPGVNVTSGTVFGGTGDKNQINLFKRKIDVIVACPGRLLQLMKNHEKVCSLKHISHLVVDEADKMLEMGFANDVKEIVRLLDKNRCGNKKSSKRRHSSLFSATFGQLEDLCCAVVAEDACLVKLQSKFKPKLPENMLHFLAKAPDTWESKKAFVANYINDPENKVGKAIVFVAEKAHCQHVVAHLKRSGISAVEIHSDKSQAQRTEAIKGFRETEFRVIVCTNILSRGIDVVDLTHVVNFAVPKNPDDYIHRVGRTARADRKGVAVTLMAGNEAEEIKDIEAFTGLTFHPISITAVGALSGVPGLNKKQRKALKRKQELEARNKMRDEHKSGVHPNYQGGKRGVTSTVPSTLQSSASDRRKKRKRSISDAPNQEKKLKVHSNNNHGEEQKFQPKQEVQGGSTPRASLKQKKKAKEKKKQKSIENASEAGSWKQKMLEMYADELG